MNSILVRTSLDVDHFGEGEKGERQRNRTEIYLLSKLSQLAKVATHIRIDYTKRGYHVIAWIPDNLCSYRIREVLGDCAGRLELDEQRPIYDRNVLWTKKGEWRILKGLSKYDEIISACQELRPL